MNLLFDLDGTLTDPKEGIVACIKHALTKLGRNAEDFGNLERFIGPPLLGSFIEMLGDEDQAKQAVQLYRERFSEVGLYENQKYPGTDEYLAKFSKAGYRLWVATSKPTIFAEKIIAHFGLTGYFEKIYGAELNERYPDKSSLIKGLIEKEQLKPTDTIMIGDRSFDIVGAKSNGVHAIGALWGYGTENELTEACADLICESPTMLFNSISKLTTHGKHKT